MTERNECDLPKRMGDCRSKRRNPLRRVEASFLMKISSAPFLLLVFLTCANMVVDAQTSASVGTLAPTMGDMQSGTANEESSPPTPSTQQFNNILPTRNPTAQPTIKPTVQPTRQPSIRPTPRPSPPPTVQPSPQPTLRPTTQPTPRPTPQPTAQPTSVPTKAPFAAPTPMPSRAPTRSATPGPTPRPSVMPSESPSKVQSQSPTQYPTVQPTTHVPTTVTLEPTVSARPSWGPSPLPTEYPSLSPVADQSSTPSLEPSPFPSAVPSSSPTLSLQGYLVDGIMEMSWLSSKLKGGAAIAWEDVTTAHIRQTILALDLEDPVFDLKVKADIFGQALLSNNPGRLLQSNDLRPLQIQFIVEVKYRSESNLHNPGDWIEEAFDTNEDRSAYINQLAEKNEAAFEDLENVELVVESAAAIEGPPDAESGDGDDKVIIIAAAAGGGAIFVGLVGYLFWNSQQTKEDDSIVEDSSPALGKSVGNVALSTEIVADGETDDISTLGVSVFGGTLMNRLGQEDEQTASINDYDWTKAYGQGSRIASVDECSSEGKKSLMSWLSHRSSWSRSSSLGLESMRSPSVLSKERSFEVQLSEDSADDEFEVEVGEEKFEVKAPPGKLGMVIDTPTGGVPAVHAMKPDSVLADRVRVGDQLVSVDGEDVTNMTSMQVCKLIGHRAGQHRLFVFIRSHRQTDSLRT